MESLPHCETLLLKKQGPTLFITINRPDVRNAMSLQMVAELATIFSQIESDLHIRAVVIRGADGHFCAGGDIKDMAGARSQKAAEGEADPFYRLNRAFGQMIQQVNESSKVVIAVTEGAVMGGGFGLACVSDMAIAGPTAKFGMPETSLGVIPAQIAPFVVERIGLTQARRLALLGLRIGAEEARTLGIVHQAAGSDQELDEMLDHALERVRQCAPVATAETKALLHRVGHEAMSGLLDSAAEKFAEAIRGSEGAEGTMAFMQKRPPAWAGDSE
ncbi:enoyl-CoA hydratase-related protein [Marinobacter sp. M216]|uniref:Enoyl-CoA hydratase-related protein n=1 Tax=Marinobacter albus TaxID=3030833 RepID=A0ABT7HCA1_9GAMM|nr:MULTISPECIES: enoyl-CoA hydratase-related protein [unclassified Marinobacter]MBW7470622.1 enoyl-CoA hydratase/isomerase family protein [Marinobacter sp. F4218]MDK9557110.1 enoyl-CoA hydratase-related protein [Marinobacter sp. M216]